MDAFAKYKEQLRKMVGALRRPGNPSEEMLKAIDAADNWEGLEKRLVDLRTVSRQLKFAALLVFARCTFEFFGDEEDDVSSQTVYGDAHYLVFR